MKNLTKKLLEIMKEVGTVKKSGYNAFQKYQYPTEADMIDAVRDKLIEKGIFVSTSAEECLKDGEITQLKFKHTFYDTESEESLDVFSYGQGHDKNDKGVFKAKTGAYKYFISKNFMLASEDDPERAGANPSYVGHSSDNTNTKPKKLNKGQTSSNKKFGKKQNVDFPEEPKKQQAAPSEKLAPSNESEETKDSSKDSSSEQESKKAPAKKAKFGKNRKSKKTDEKPNLVANFGHAQAAEGNEPDF